MSVKSIKVDDSEKSISTYFNEIKNTKPLTKMEEMKLWERFHKQKDLSAREKLINANLKFVPTVAKQFKGCGLPFADIIEEGNIGLIKAIDRFNPKKDNKVISYAVWWIRKTIIEAIEKRGVLDTDNIDDIYNQTISQEKKYQNDDVSKMIVHEKKYFDDEIDSSPNMKEIIEDLFDGVPERERTIISDYFGLYGDAPRTLDEIGIETNLTRERIRQLNEKTLKKMRANALVKDISLANI